VRGEQFAGTRVTGEPQRTLREVAIQSVISVRRVRARGLQRPVGRVPSCGGTSVVTYSVQLNGTGVAVGLARDLAENPVPAASLGQHHRRTQFGRGEIGEGEVNYDNLPGCTGTLIWKKRGSS
jgi:hypothetical protein